MNLCYYQIVICQIVLIFGNDTDLFFREKLKRKPEIILNDLKFGHNVIGSNLKLECHSRLYANYVSIEWNIPEQVTQRTITLRENTDSIYVQTSTLVIENPPHLGSYYCYVKLPVVNRVMDSNQLEITLYAFSDSDKNVVEVNKDDTLFNAADAEITIKFKAHPNVTVAWNDHRGKIIDNSSNTTISQLTAISDNSYNYKATLTFQSLTEDDLGTYIVFIGNTYTQIEVRIEIDLNEQVKTSLTIVSLDEDEMMATYECKAAGNPKPNIIWTFQPCDVFDFSETEFSVEPILLNESYFDDRGLQIISHVSLNLSKSGILQCVTRNNRVQEYAFYVKNEFDMLTSVSLEHGKVYLGYAQTLKLLCLASFYKYLDLYRWYHNNIYINNEGDSIYEFKYPKYILQNGAQISFDLRHEFQLGNYSCVCLTRTGKTESKTVEVHFKSMPNLWPQTYLQDLNGGHTIVGQDIRLMCNITFHEHVQILWKFVKTERKEFLEKSKIPLPVENYVERHKFKQKDIETVNSNIHITTSYLTISKSNTSETGYFGCGVSVRGQFFSHYIWVRIYDATESHISFDKSSKFDIQNLKIEIFMTAHPHPTIQWFDNNRNEIPLGFSDTSNFLASFQQILNSTNTYTNYKVSLSFKNLTLENFGNYTIVAKNEYEEANYSIEVNVTGVPSTKINIATFSTERALLKCSAIASPKPTIQWYFKKCTTLTNCLKFTDVKSLKININISINESWNETKDFQHISYISLNLSERGVLRCKSTNEFGQDLVHEPILGFGNEFEIFADGRNLNRPIELVGSAIKLNVTCATTSYNYTGEFSVFYENRELDILEYHPFVPPGTGTKYRYLLSNFVIVTIPVKSSGDSYYSCTVLNKNGSLKTQSLHLRSKLTASITFNNTNMHNNSVYVDINSKLVLYCYIDGFPKPTVKWFKNEEIISSVETITFSKNGQMFEIGNTSPDDEGTYMCEASNMYVRIVTFTTVHVVIKHTWLYVQTLLLLLAFLFVATLAFIKFRNEKTLRENLELVGLSYFRKSPLDRINPKLGVENQANLLPYDTKWEIPIEKIIIGKQLGSGAFGVTFQGNIIDYFSDDLNKTVAVKSVNALSGVESIKALASEIKIMSHLGKHVNVVNFLGACTKHVTKRELYVVLEFCSFGDILHYIRRRSECFLDQKDHNQDTFKWTDNEDSFQTKDIITSKDLLLWSFQIARGMDYLGFRRIVHGDLAARNVLLTDNNVVKVCDFGLAEHLYNYNNYVTKTEGRLPIKWMAVEAIERGIFSIQSDVWSFGIVLWEFFSLGKTPYIGISSDKTFCKLLIDGYRMEKPEAATADIYKFMLDCWNINPSLRPSFASLESQIGLLLEETVRDHYVEMNKGYMLMNKQQFDSGEDYLTMLLSPTYENIVSQLSENLQEEY